MKLLVRYHAENYGKMTRRLQIGKVWESLNEESYKRAAPLPVKMVACCHSAFSYQSRA